MSCLLMKLNSDGVGEVGQISGGDSGGATLTWPETVRRAVLRLFGAPRSQI